jgi:uncharacterized protein YcbK (DUF882 family)
MENQEKPTIQLTKNFNLSEFHCRNGIWVPALYYPNVNKLAFNLQVLRDHIKKPIIINSGYRTKQYNKDHGGSPFSQHLKAGAADFKIPGISNYVIHRMIEELIFEEFMSQGGLGLYDEFIHYDVRGFRARWDLRTL